MTAPSVEVTNISGHGIWLLTGGRELFLPYRDFPWFKEQTVAAPAAQRIEKAFLRLLTRQRTIRHTRLHRRARHPRFFRQTHTPNIPDCGGASVLKILRTPGQSPAWRLRVAAVYSSIPPLK